MRIDFSWGSDRTRVEHPVCRLAELVLSPWVSDRSFGPALPWLDVLFVVAGSRAPKPAKATWRWRNTFAEHLIAELPAPAIEHMAQGEAALTLIALAQQAIGLARPQLDPTLRFAASELAMCIADCLRQPPSPRELRKLQAPQQRMSRFAAIELGKQAMRREWQRPLRKPLNWVRLFPVLGKGVRASSMLRKECRIVEALLGSALFGAILTPRYSEIYVNVGSDANTLRIERSAVEEWHENAYAVLTPKQLAESEPRKLRRTLFKESCRALLELAEIDHLDSAVIKAQLDAIDVQELGTEFVYKRMENDGRFAEIYYSLADRRDAGAIMQPNFRLRIGLSGAGAVASTLLGPVDLHMAGKAISKFELRRSQARVSVARKVVALAFPD